MNTSVLMGHSAVEHALANNVARSLEVRALTKPGGFSSRRRPAQRARAVQTSGGPSWRSKYLHAGVPGGSAGPRLPVKARNFAQPLTRVVSTISPAALRTCFQQPR